MDSSSKPVMISNPMMMRNSTAVLFAVLLASATLVAGCDSADPEPPVQTSEGWEALGLHSDTVRTLRLDGSRLYAGTHRGVHVRELSAAAAWSPAGLQDRLVYDLAVLAPGRLLAAVEISGMGADTTSLFLTEDGGLTWRAFQNGFGAGEGSNGVRSFATSGGRLFASGSGAVVAASDDGAASWQKLWGDWRFGAASTFVNTDPRWPDVVWAGGESGRFQPFLLRSTDRGATWAEIWLNLGGDQAHHVVAIHPHDAQTVFTGTEGIVLRSIDGGDTWERVLEDRHYFTGIHVSAQYPGRVYVGGWLLDGDDVVHLFVSDDGGGTWAVRRPEGPEPGGVRRLVVVEHAAEEALYLATTHGVYRYKAPH
jgi:photosystem II stability/assembly factor-like uncharacterized protein